MLRQMSDMPAGTIGFEASARSRTTTGRTRSSRCCARDGRGREDAAALPAGARGRRRGRRDEGGHRLPGSPRKVVRARGRGQDEDWIKPAMQALSFLLPGKREGVRRARIWPPPRRGSPRGSSARRDAGKQLGRALALVLGAAHVRAAAVLGGQRTSRAALIVLALRRRRAGRGWYGCPAPRRRRRSDRRGVPCSPPRSCVIVDAGSLVAVLIVVRRRLRRSRRRASRVPRPRPAAGRGPAEPAGAVLQPEVRRRQGGDASRSPRRRAPAASSRSS